MNFYVKIYGQKSKIINLALKSILKWKKVSNMLSRAQWLLSGSVVLYSFYAQWERFLGQKGQILPTGTLNFYFF